MLIFFSGNENYAIFFRNYGLWLVRPTFLSVRQSDCPTILCRTFPGRPSDPGGHCPRPFWSRTPALEISFPNFPEKRNLRLFSEIWYRREITEISQKKSKARKKSPRENWKKFGAQTLQCDPPFIFASTFLSVRSQHMSVTVFPLFLSLIFILLYDYTDYNVTDTESPFLYFELR